MPVILEIAGKWPLEFGEVYGVRVRFTIENHMIWLSESKSMAFVALNPMLLGA
jgi:hypothetical protein